jgi:sugar/nucleoside kinase (ribokinase family)
MSLLVTGSIGIDDLRTPFGEVQGAYGGSAVHFSFAASLFTPVRFVGVVGEDFSPEYRKFLQTRPIDLDGLEVRKGSKTFHWSGQYEGAMAEATTLNIELNVLAEAGPKIPPSYADSEFVFLAATHPVLQQDLVRQLQTPRLIVADTRDLWITTQREELLKTLDVVHGAIMNDGEARLLTEEHNLILAGRRILDWGPLFVVLKKGEHGVMLITREKVVTLPAYPTSRVVDPTGAGDSFAGGMMGYLSTQPEANFNALRRALAYGTVTASYTIEDFALGSIQKVTPADVDRRLKEFADMLVLG